MNLTLWDATACMVKDPSLRDGRLSMPFSSATSWRRGSGPASLRYALTRVSVLGGWAALHDTVTGRTLPDDLVARAGVAA